MAINKDGLESGAPVDFATIKRVERERKLKEAQNDAKPKPKPESKRAAAKPAKRDTATDKKAVFNDLFA